MTVDVVTINHEQSRPPTNADKDITNHSSQLLRSSCSPPVPSIGGCVLLIATSSVLAVIASQSALGTHTLPSNGGQTNESVIHTSSNPFIGMDWIQLPRVRWLEDEADEDDEADNEGDGEQENDEADRGNDDAEDKEEDQEEEAGQNDDDAYQNGDDAAEQGADDDDAGQNEVVQDDFVFDDYYRVDDYYAYEEDPKAYRTLIPISINDVLAFLLASMGITLAAGGGIGGGGIAVPIYILILRFIAKYAVPLGSFSVLGGAIASTSLNIRKRHPLADRPLIDWNLMLVMEPLVLVGALFGAILHRLLSDKLLVVLLVLLLCLVARSMLTKAKKMFDAETAYIAQMESHNAKVKIPSKYAGYIPPVDSQSTESNTTDEELNANVRQQILIVNPDFISLRSSLMEKEKTTPRSKIIVLCLMFCIIIFLNIMVGGGAFPSPWGIQCGGLSFWVVHVITAAFLVASAWAAQTYLVHQHEIKQLIRFGYVHGDIQWDKKGSVVYPLIFCASGIFAGMFGIGGGVIVVPMLLHLGIHPHVATATSSCMIVFTSFASITSFATFGLVLWDYAAVCFFVGLFASYFGIMVMNQARRTQQENGQNFERNSIIAFAIGYVVLLSALLMTVQYIFTIINVDNTDDDDRGGLCEGYQRGHV